MSGTGHFGDQTGDAGQAKPVFSRVNVDRPWDQIQNLLWDNGITVEVHSYEENLITGVTRIYVSGRDSQIAAAVNFCKARRPPIDVTYRKRKSTSGDVGC